MIRDQFRLDLNDAIFVDNFAGGGGASTGFYMATGRHVDHAINHDSFALGMHRINHPQTVHHCEDVYDVYPEEFGRPIGGAWFSPDCKHHSKAKGGKPRDKKIRALAFVMLRYAKFGKRQLAETGQGMTMYMENVEEIAKWGPLLPNGKPDKRHEGRTWRGFLDALGAGIAPDHPDIAEMLECLGDSVTREELVEGFGFAIETKEIRSFVYGTPTIRKRLYKVSRNDGKRIVWPEVTHAAPQNFPGRRMKKWHTIAECLDFSLPCPSIFLTPEEARKWRCRRPLKRNTLRRVAKGMDRYVLKAKRPFIIPLTHQGGDRMESVDQPANTITGAHRGEKAVVQASFVTEHANGSSQRNMPVDEPGRTQCAEVKGGHFAMVAGTMVQTGYGERDGQEPRTLDLEKPGTTVVAGGAKQAFVAASLVHTAHGEQDKNGKKRGRGAKEITEPLPSVLGSQDCALVAAHLLRYNGEKGQNDAARGQGLEDPISTQDTSNRFGVITAHLARDFGQSVGQSVEEPAPTVMPGGQGKTKVVSATVVNVANSKTTGRGPNTWPVDEPGRTITSAPGFGVTAASMVKLRGENIGYPADEPTQTISAGGQHHALATVHLAQNNDGYNTNPGHPADEPSSTIAATGSQQSVVMGSVVKYYGNEKDGQDIDAAAHTVTTKDRFGLNQSLGVYQPLTPEQEAGARRVAAFLREFGVEFEGEYATVEGYVIVDIGLRMLTPRELFRAQGFPDDYIIDRAWIVDPKTGEIVTVHLTKEQQIRMCGNSVCPQVAAALIRANNPEMVVRNFTERQTRSMEVMAA